ncbi:hypothetical protein JXB27_01560 [Candidatus Woesearchaeota archaeon]|nr:hypothetical protein [Candidatus Woesearchaeota archaeon]
MQPFIYADAQRYFGKINHERTSYFVSSFVSFRDRKRYYVADIYARNLSRFRKELNRNWPDRGTPHFIDGKYEAAIIDSEGKKIEDLVITPVRSAEKTKINSWISALIRAKKQKRIEDAKLRKEKKARMKAAAEERRQRSLEDDLSEEEQL